MDHNRANASSSLVVWLSGCLVVAASLAAGWPTLFPNQFFLGDDFGLVKHLHQVPFHKLVSYFWSDWTEGVYGMQLDELRPVLGFSYRLDSFLFGATNATGYHATNVLLHSLNALLVCAIARAVAPANRWAGLVAGTLFAILPCQAETIAWISGRVDSLATLFYLGSILCFVRFRSQRSSRYYLWSLGLFTVGLFAKQSVVTLPILLLAYEMIYGPQARFVLRFAPHVPFLTVLALHLGLRRALFGSALRESSLHFGLFTEFARRQAFYMKSLLPFALDYSHPARVAIGTITILILAALVWSLAAGRAKNASTLRAVLFFGPVWYAITVSPMIVTYTSARHLYLTAAGFSIAIALLILPERMDRVVARIGILGCLVLLYGAALTRSIRPWVENGVASDRISSGLPGVMRSIPRGSIVFLAIPAMRNNVYFWSFALPFALQPPFAGEDLYSGFQIVGFSEAYCCPPPQWFRHEQPVLRRLTEGQPANKGIYVVSLDESSGELVVAQRAVNGPELKAKIEGALRRPLAPGDFAISRGDAVRVSEVLLSDWTTGR